MREKNVINSYSGERDEPEPSSFTVSVTTAGQSVEAASGCAAASDRVAPLRSAPNGGSSCGEAAPVADNPRSDSAPRRSAPGPAGPSAPASAFFPRLVSCVRNQVASKDKAWWWCQPSHVLTW